MIGIGTAFGLLLLLMLITVLVYWFNTYVLDKFAEKASRRKVQTDREARDKGLAAVIAVAALRGNKMALSNVRSEN